MLLLDSQVALWLVDDNPRLGPRTRLRIGDADIVYVSAGTIWELTIKAMLGKVAVPADFDDLLVAQGVTSLPVSSDHAAGVEHFPELLRHDPFDRLLMSQARLERADLVTADRVLLAGKYDFVLDATE